METAFVTNPRHPEIEDDDRPLAGALADLGALVLSVPWDDREFDWDRVDLALIRSTWAYYQRLDEFLGQLAAEEKVEEGDSPMPIRVVQLGTPRAKGEGVRLGTVRRPPRGVSKTEFASRDFYDVWLPDLAPSEGLVKKALRAETAKDWASFEKKYRAEMKRPEATRFLALLAALSPRASFSVGCYCLDPARCHRSVLRALLVEHGARLA